MSIPGSVWGTSWSSVACRSTSARTTGRSSPPGRCGCGSHPLEPQPSSSHRVALGRMGMLRASTASLGTNSWTGNSSIPSGRCRSSPSSGATSTTNLGRRLIGVARDVYTDDGNSSGAAVARRHAKVEGPGRIAGRPRHVRGGLNGVAGTVHDRNLR